ncbi:hypothetical protein DPMN_125625 [Dreissena polymorpha]|uniref:Uncharacterized protein n=1 Tax=Dreissena polymorpha TaxID=45954 RepID=A0A9D4JXD3_DREPO|nr:hypothetical protein DPMN_125625 [Dreissena polymorpha]
MKYCVCVFLQYEEESKEVCILMSWLGYGPECTQKRPVCYNEYARLMSAYHESMGLYNCIIAGSKSEGLTCYIENAIDTLWVVSNVVCLEDCLHIRVIPDDTVAFMMATKYTYPGHYRLLLM